MARLTKPVPESTGLSLHDAARMWATSLRAANRGERTIGQYMYALNVVEDILGGDHPVKTITTGDIEQVVVNLKDRAWKPSTVSSVYRPLRTFLNWCVTREYIARSPMAAMKAPTVPVEPAAFPTPDQLRRVLATCQSRSRHNYRGVRDEAILRMFATTGLRLAELTNLRMTDLQLTVPSPTATVLGKGRKVRSVPLDDPTVAALRLYLRTERPRSPYAATTDRVWLAPRGPMTESGVAQMVADRGAKVGVALHPHALRHFTIHTLLSAGLSEGDTMAISGHSSRSMMDRYGAAQRAQRADAAFRAAPRAAL